MLIDGYSEFHQEKQKPLIGIKELKKLYELKDYQARLLYRYAGDYIVIVGATLKKSDFDTKNKMFYINCKKQSNNYVKTVEKGGDIQKFIAQSQEFYGKIIDEDGVLKK